jgi:hypothetical protein
MNESEKEVSWLDLRGPTPTPWHEIKETEILKEGIASDSCPFPRIKRDIASRSAMDLINHSMHLE